MEVKAYGRVEVKALDDQQGTYDAIVSVFGNVDDYNDVVVKGAFTDSLAEWAAKGDPIPVVYSHGWMEPPIGKTLSIEESDEGLVTHNQLYVDQPRAAEVYNALKDRTITNHSFAYDVIDSEDEESETAEGATVCVRQLKALDLIEHGPCLRGVNTATDTLAVKGPVGVLITAELKRVFERIDELAAGLAALKAAPATAEAEAAPVESALSRELRSLELDSFDLLAS